MGLQNDGEPMMSLVVKMSGKTYQKPVTPLDQSTDSLFYIVKLIKRRNKIDL